MQTLSFRSAFAAGAALFMSAAVFAGCSGGGGSKTPIIVASGSPAPGSSPTAAAATANYTGTANSGPFALPTNGGFSGSLGETISNPGASHSSVSIQISDYQGVPPLPSNVSLGTNNLNVFFSFAETIGPGQSGDSASVGNPFATTLTFPASVPTSGVKFYSQICSYNSASNAFNCDSSSVQTQNITGNTLVDDNAGTQAAGFVGPGGIPTESLAYGVTYYKLFFTVAQSSSTPTAQPSLGPATTVATTVPFSVGSQNFPIPQAAGYTGTLNESVQSITSGGTNVASSSMLLTAANGIPSPLPSGVTITPQNSTVFYTLVQQVAPGALPGSTAGGTATFQNPFALTLNVPLGFPLVGTPIYSQLCYYYGGSNPSFSCDPSAQAVSNVNASTNTIVDLNYGTNNQYWTLSNSGGSELAGQAFYLAVYKIFYYPTGSSSHAIARGPSLSVLRGAPR